MVKAILVLFLQLLWLLCHKMPPTVFREEPPPPPLSERVELGENVDGKMKKWTKTGTQESIRRAMVFFSFIFTISAAGHSWQRLRRVKWLLCVARWLPWWCFQRFLPNNLPWKLVVFCLSTGNADNSWIIILQLGPQWGIHWNWLIWDDKIPLEIITNINFTTNLSQCIHCSTALLFRFPLWPSCGCNIDQDLNCFSDSIQSIYWQNCSSLCSTLALRCASLGLSICNWIFVFIKRLL